MENGMHIQKACQVERNVADFGWFVCWKSIIFFLNFIIENHNSMVNVHNLTLFDFLLGVFFHCNIYGLHRIFNLVQDFKWTCIFWKILYDYSMVFLLKLAFFDIVTRHVWSTFETYYWWALTSDGNYTYPKIQGEHKILQLKAKKKYRWSPEESTFGMSQALDMLSGNLWNFDKMVKLGIMVQLSMRSWVCVMYDQCKVSLYMVMH